MFLSSQQKSIYSIDIFPVWTIEMHEVILNCNRLQFLLSIHDPIIRLQMLNG